MINKMVNMKLNKIIACNYLVGQYGRQGFP